MKTAAMLLLIAYRLEAQPASVAGVVIDQTTGAPLEHVHLSLYGGNLERHPELVYGAMSDKNGHISVAGMPPGRYAVVLKRSGYMQAGPPDPTNSTFVVLKAGQTISDLKLEMSPSSMVSGRVVDQYGDPMQHTDVQLLPLQRGAGEIQVSSTDERGEFRIVSGPGKFYLQARPNQVDRGSREIRTDGSSEPIYGLTYYPDVAAEERATVIEVPAGHDVDRLEIHLTSAAPEPRFNVSGTVTNRPGEMPAFVEVRPVDNQRFEPEGPGAVDPKTGQFALQGLLPGTYDLLVRLSLGDSKLSGGARVTVGNADVNNLEIALGPPPELTGTVELGDVPAANRMVRLQFGGNDLEEAFSSGLPPSGPSGNLAQDGSFRITDFQPGKYKLVIDPLPDEAYIASVEVDGVAASNRVVELSAGARPPRLKISLASDGATISGRILDPDGEPVPDEPPVFLLANPDLKGGILVEAKAGQYEFKSVRPGKYRLILLSFDGIGGGDDESQFKETLQKAFESAEEIEIRPRARISKDLREKP